MEMALCRQLIGLVLTTKQGNKTLHTPENTKEKQITTALDNKNYTVVWYAVYDLRPGNGAGLILTAPEPTWYSERVGG